MSAMIKRSVVPTCLLLVGIASFVYGMRFHVLPVTQTVLETIEVEQEREVQRKIPLHDPFQPPPGFPGAPPGFPQPPPMFETVIEKYKVSKDVSRGVTKDELESVVVQETTVGGLKRLKSGGLKRTYDLVRTKDGKISTKGPPGCPT